MGKMPRIKVFNKKNPQKVDPNLSARVAIVGVFDTTETTPLICKDLDDAYTKLGTDTTKDGCRVLPLIFKGATSVLGVPVEELTTSNIIDALARIKNERFDILYIAGIYTDEFLPIITTFTAERYLNKKPIGYIGATANTTLEQYSATKELLDDACYGIIANQTVIVNNVEYDLLETSAYYCAVVCSTPVRDSLTQKQLPNVTSVGSEYTFEEGDLGTSIVGLGFTVFQCYDRENDVYIVVNAEQPNGYDLYINRVRDYVIREFSLQQFLGERNRPRTLGEIKQEISRVKEVCVNTLDLLEDIKYNIIKKSQKCVDVNITKLLFSDVITCIDVYITLEVE